MLLQMVVYIVLCCIIICIIATPKLTELYARHLIKHYHEELSTKLNAMEQNKNID